MKISQYPLFRSIVHWYKATNNAIEGILHATKHHRYLRFHLFVFFILLLFSFIIGVERHEFIILTLVSLVVIIAEMFNSAIETIVDIIAPEKNDSARIAKDIAAGAVLICAFGAIITGYLVLWPYLVKLFTEGPWISHHYPENIAILSITLVIMIVIVTKAILGSGQPLRGGFPSGHAAISFSLWISITQFSHNPYVIYSTLILAFLVSINQWLRKVHNLVDITIGAMIGLFITKILFLVFLKK